jgi:hypothetical protein
MKYLVHGLVFCLCFAATLLLAALPFLWIWNYAVVAALTIARPITYWPAFWLLLFLGVFVAGSRESLKVASTCADVEPLISSPEATTVLKHEVK